MTLPEPLTVTFSGLIGDIEKGLIKIPQFQRDFVWDIEKSANLKIVSKRISNRYFYFLENERAFTLYSEYWRHCSSKPREW